jgi:hypothetical protein
LTSRATHSPRKKYSRTPDPLTPKGIAKPRQSYWPTHYQAKLAAYTQLVIISSMMQTERSAGFIRTAQSLSRRSPQRQA